MLYLQAVTLSLSLLAKATLAPSSQGGEHHLGLNGFRTIKGVSPLKFLCCITSRGGTTGTFLTCMALGRLLHGGIIKIRISSFSRMYMASGSA